MKIKKKRGISLVALVITIIVLIILTATIMIMFNQGGMIGKAEEATFKSDFSNILDSFMLYKNELMLERLGNVNDIEADSEEKIKEYIPLLANNNKIIDKYKYTDLIQIYDSKIYQSDDIAKLSTEKDKEISRWLEEIGITILNKPSKTDIIEIANTGWMIQKDGDEYSIIGYNGTGDDRTTLIIPNRAIYEGTEVAITKINQENSSNRLGLKFTNVEEVIVPEGIIEITGYIPLSFQNLKSVELPNTLEKIGGDTFWDCNKLEGIVIPDSVTFIAAQAFISCTSLKSVVLSENITGINSSCFRYCRSLESIKIPDKVQYINPDAFLSCEKLSVVEFGANSQLKGLSSGAFSCCSNLEQIQLPNSLETISSFAFSSCGKLSNITIPSSVTNVGERAFTFCAENLEINVNKKLLDCTGFVENWNCKDNNKNTYYKVNYLPE